MRQKRLRSPERESPQLPVAKSARLLAAEGLTSKTLERAKYPLKSPRSTHSASHVLTGTERGNAQEATRLPRSPRPLSARISPPTLLARLSARTRSCLQPRAPPLTSQERLWEKRDLLTRISDHYRPPPALHQRLTVTREPVNIVTGIPIVNRKQTLIVNQLGPPVTKDQSITELRTVKSSLSGGARKTPSVRNPALQTSTVILGNRSVDQLCLSLSNKGERRTCWTDGTSPRGLSRRPSGTLHEHLLSPVSLEASTNVSSLASSLTLTRSTPQSTPSLPKPACAQGSPTQSPSSLKVNSPVRSKLQPESQTRHLTLSPPTCYSPRCYLSSASTGGKSLLPTLPTFRQCSPVCPPLITSVSSTMIKPYDFSSPSPMTSRSTSLEDSHILREQISIPWESMSSQTYPFFVPPKTDSPSVASETQGPRRYVGTSMQVAASSPHPSAPTVMSALTVTGQDMHPKITSALKDHKSLHRHELLFTKRPRFARGFLWEADEPSLSATYNYSLTALPLPSPPSFDDLPCELVDTLKDNPDLFQIVTPINIDLLQQDLAAHPNPSFVKSVLAGFRTGFWPWANICQPGYPITHDESLPMPSDTAHATFTREQCLVEQVAGRYSQFFGDRLLPGMYCMPQHVVARDNGKLRLVTNHSAGPYSLNSMIPLTERSFPLDGIQNLGRSIRRQRLRYPLREQTLFKSDIKSAYRLLPMHPAWQIKQIVLIDGQYCVDRCNAFGGAASGRLFVAFNSLLLWLARHVHNIPDLHSYVDDSFSSETDAVFVHYDPYKSSFPSHQVRLLRMWDKYGVPHAQPKQLFGVELPIIGFLVHAQTLEVSLERSKINDLIQAIHLFVATGSSTSSRRRPLRDFQRLAGWINWALNVFPLLRPGLAPLYAKIHGKTKALALVYVSDEVAQGLLWIVQHLQSSNGVFMLKAIAWGPYDADAVLYTDASFLGLGIWCPASNTGRFAALPSAAPTGTIYYFEAYTVVCAILWASTWPLSIRPRRLAIYSDNSNTVAMFNTLRALPPYNPLLSLAVDMLIQHEIDLRVSHIAGSSNTAADLLSRLKFEELRHQFPGIQIARFAPPDVPSGVRPT